MCHYTYHAICEEGQLCSPPPPNTASPYPVFGAAQVQTQHNFKMGKKKAGMSKKAKKERNNRLVCAYLDPPPLLPRCLLLPEPSPTPYPVTQHNAHRNNKKRHN